MKVYKKFFGAQPRRAAFTKLNKGITTASQMHLAVMAAICGTTDMQPGSIVQAVIRGGTDMASNEVFQSLRSYGAEEPFWALVKQASGYSEGEDASIERMITHILLTATTRTLRIEYLAGLDSFISTPHQAWCYDFVSEWIAEEEKPELTEILRSVEEELNLRKRFQQIPMEDLVRTEVFPCVNECILTQRGHPSGGEDAGVLPGAFCRIPYGRGEKGLEGIYRRLLSHGYLLPPVPPGVWKEPDGGE